LNDWINNNFNELKTICHKISKEEDVDDLLQICVEQFLTNKKIDTIPVGERLYFFARIVRNNYYSKTSHYHNTYRKHKFNDIPDTGIPDIIYEEPEINLDWIDIQISNGKKTNDWYFWRLLELYIYEVGGSISRLSELTTIPINSVSRDINKIRKILRHKRNKLL
jgi:hypothetical protein